MFAVRSMLTGRRAFALPLAIILYVAWLNFDAPARNGDSNGPEPASRARPADIAAGGRSDPVIRRVGGGSAVPETGQMVPFRFNPWSEDIVAIPVKDLRDWSICRDVVRQCEEHLLRIVREKEQACRDEDVHQLIEALIAEPVVLPKDLPRGLRICGGHPRVRRLIAMMKESEEGRAAIEAELRLAFADFDSLPSRSSGKTPLEEPTQVDPMGYFFLPYLAVRVQMPPLDLLRLLTHLSASHQKALLDILQTEKKDDPRLESVDFIVSEFVTYLAYGCDYALATLAWSTESLTSEQKSALEDYMEQRNTVLGPDEYRWDFRTGVFKLQDYGRPILEAAESIAGQDETDHVRQTENGHGHRHRPIVSSVPEGTVSKTDPAAGGQSQGQGENDPPRATPDQNILRFLASHRRICKSIPVDPGAVEVYLENRGDAPIGIRELFWNGVSSDEGTDVLWWKLTPARLSAGGVARLCVRLWDIPAVKAKIGLDLADDRYVEIGVSAAETPLRIVGWYFDNDLSKSYAYWRNETHQPLTVRRVDCHDVRLPSELVEWRAIPVTVSPGSLGCVAIQMPASLQPGGYAHVQLTCDGALTVHKVSRVWRRFPLSLHTGESIPGLDAESWEYLHRLQRETQLANPERALYLALAHPVEQQGSFRRIAADAINGIARAGTFSAVPSLAEIGRFRIITGLAAFSQICDMNRVNLATALTTEPALASEWEPRAHPCQQLLELAKDAGGARPLQVTVPFVGLYDDEIAELGMLRMLAGYAVSRGAKGIVFAASAAQLEKRADDAEFQQRTTELLQVVRDLQELAPLLQIAEPVELGSCSLTSVEPATLLAGDKEIILVLIQHGWKEHLLAQRRQAALYPAEPGPIGVHVDPPPGWRIISAMESGAIEPPDVSLQAGSVDISVTNFRGVRFYRLPIRPSEASSRSAVSEDLRQAQGQPHKAFVRADQ